MDKKEIFVSENLTFTPWTRRIVLLMYFMESSSYFLTCVNSKKHAEIFIKLKMSGSFLKRLFYTLKVYIA